MRSFLLAFRAARLRCFGDLLAGSMDEEEIGNVVAAPFAVSLTMFVSGMANALKEERVVKEGMSVLTCGGPALLCGSRTSR